MSTINKPSISFNQDTNKYLALITEPRSSSCSLKAGNASAFLNNAAANVPWAVVIYHAVTRPLASLPPFPINKKAWRCSIWCIRLIRADLFVYFMFICMSTLPTLVLCLLLFLVVVYLFSVVTFLLLHFMEAKNGASSFKYNPGCVTQLATIHACSLHTHTSHTGDITLLNCLLYSNLEVRPFAQCENIKGETYGP